MPSLRSHRRPRRGLRAATLLTVLLPLLGGAAVDTPAHAQSRSQRPQPQVSGVPGERGEHLQVYAYTLRHKPASEALALIRPMLTSRGTVELQPRGNTLVVRDTLAALGRIVPALRGYDRPPEPLEMEIMVVRADSRPPKGPTGDRSLPGWLEERLRGLLRWDYYRVLADSGVRARENQAVTHEVGGRYGVSFRLGSVQPGDRVKLHDFKVWRIDPDRPGRGGLVAGEPLVEATLNLWLDKPKVLGLANSESSEHALMVVLTCERARPAAQVSGDPDRRSGGRP